MIDSEECVVCRYVTGAHDPFTLPCCSHDLHFIVRSFQACGAQRSLCQISLDHVAQSEQFQATVGFDVDVVVQESIPEPVASMSVVAHPCGRTLLILFRWTIAAWNGRQCTLPRLDQIQFGLGSGFVGLVPGLSESPISLPCH